MRNRMQSNPAGEISKCSVNAATGCPGAEEELVAATKSGDEGTFEILVECHRKRIFTLALRYTRVREGAEDIVQQTFHKAFVYIEKFEGESSFSTWLTRIAINEALMLLRRRRALREEFIDDSNSGDRTIPGLDLAMEAQIPKSATYNEKEDEFCPRRLRS